MVEVGLSPSREFSCPCVSRMRIGNWNCAGSVGGAGVEVGGEEEEEDNVEVEAALGEEGATVAVGMERGGVTVAVCWVCWKERGVRERIHVMLLLFIYPFFLAALSPLLTL